MDLLDPGEEKVDRPLKQLSFLAQISNLRARVWKHSPSGHEFSTRIETVFCAGQRVVWESRRQDLDGT